MTDMISEPKPPRVAPALLRERSDRLAQASAELRQELFGIDAQIDRVIESIRAWYVLPHIISRPVIVCLWGLTGTGKTQLTRSLARKLGFYDRFVEVQMDGFSHSTSRRRNDSISSLLAESSIAQSEPGVLVLDEFQRFRTVDEKGKDVAVKRYQDVWQLLSDGRLPPSVDFLQELEMSLAESHYEREEATRGAEAGGSAEKPPRFSLKPWQARELKQTLKLKEPLQDIMTWAPDQVQMRMLAFSESAQSWETDYSRLLIFVSGNLDEMYHGLAGLVQDCDTDADVFHELTRKLSVIDVKKALAERFRPEQVARLGNNHVVYPSMTQATYERLIRRACDSYAREIAQRAGLAFEIDASVHAGIYANAVFPAQGTRPLFSSIHAILSAPLVNAVIWALEQGFPVDAPLHVSLDTVRHVLVVTDKGGARFEQHVPLDLARIRKRASPDFRALLAVHEAGHALVYGRLFGRAPREVKINIASFEGGYNSYAPVKAESLRNCLDRLCVSLAGRAAETMVFGRNACTSGSESDFRNATALAAQHVRHFGFGDRLSRTDVTQNPDDHLNTDIAPTNAMIEALLQAQLGRARALLQQEAQALLRIVDELLAHGQVDALTMAQLLGVAVANDTDADADADASQMLTPYAGLLQAFARRQQTMAESAPLATGAATAFRSAAGPPGPATRGGSAPRPAAAPA